MKDETSANVVVGNYQLTAALPNGRSITVSAYLLEGDSPEVLNQRLDFHQAAIERQRVRCEIPELEGKREQMVQHLGGIHERLKQLGAKAKEGKLSSAERLEFQNSTVNIERIGKEIEKGDTAIAEARRKAGVAG